MHLNDFAFIFNGKARRPLTQEEAHYLSPVDLKVTGRHDSALLLLHGFASSPAVYRAIIPQLTGYDRIICPVLSGHAESIQAFSTATAEDWRRSAHQVCEALVGTYRQVSVVGFSLGGLLALELSQVYSLHHLYLLAPALSFYYPLHLILKLTDVLHAMGLFSVPNYAGYFYADTYQELSYRRFPLHAVIEILRMIKTQPWIMPTCPTDFFFGLKDKVIDTRVIAKHYAHHPMMQVHWLKHSKHILPLDGDIEAIVQKIVNKAKS